MLLFLYLNETLTIFLALVAGSMAYKKMNRFYRCLFYQLACAAILYILSHVVTKYQKHNHLPLNNHWVFNLTTLIETSLMILAAYYHFTEKITKRFILLLYVFFIITYLLLLLRSGFNTFNSFAYVIGCFAISLIYCKILYDHFYSSIHFNSPLLWVCLGALLYFAANIPYLSLMDYLNENYLHINSKLFRFIPNVFSNIRYLCLAIGFWLIRRHAPKSVPDAILR